jgi:hexosaminidase
MKQVFAAVFFFGLLLSLNAQYSMQRYPLIPKPQTLLPNSDNFSFSRAVTIVTEQKSARKECEFFRSQVRELYNIPLQYGKAAGFEPCIWISLDSFGLPPEGYELYITKDGINLYGSRAGVFYGLQTLLQLIQSDANGALFLPGCSVIDYPRFSWRGMHLDVARHFFPKENVKDYLRWMAMYKLNTFHWHLTDDQGWRIEIRKLPLLTKIGAWRKQTLIGHFSEEPDRYDGIPHGGFYTQEEVREVLAFADSLHITVVPEIEMPGHASAMIAAYPYLGNGFTTTEVQGTWGVFTEVLSPKDSTFTALEMILSEVAELFPGPYIHIGGDECPKDEWKKSRYCQQLIREHQLQDEQGLQSWFIRRIVNFLATKNKKAIGWDEILEGGLADGAAVMSWRGEEGAVAAAKAHHNVVMTPGAYCYFDYYQSQRAEEPLAIGGFLPIEKVYSFDPVPEALSPAEKKYILGVQANVWTEYMQDFSQVEYMIFPRITALAEVAWSRNDIKDFRWFVPRVMAHMKLYDKMHLNYSRSMFEIKPRYESLPNGGIRLHLSTFSALGEIKFSRNGKELTFYDSLYTGGIVITKDDIITAVVYDGDNKISPVYRQQFHAHSAFGRNVELRKAPAPAYNTGGGLTLTDGITGRVPWTGAQWLGWWGDTADIIIDLGRDTFVHTITAHVLGDPGSWIHYPARVMFYHSPSQLNVPPGNDSLWSTDFGVSAVTQLPSKGFEKAELQATPHDFRYRYLRIVLIADDIPKNYPGYGHPAWLFVSEISVD